jgi:N6-adenosine-specific RNA methylase IME4
MSSNFNPRDFATVDGYGAVLADPPWDFKTWSAKGEGRSARRHYNIMPLDEIKALPVGAVAADDSVLFLWATWPLLNAPFEVITAWGYTYKTLAFIWVKVSKSGKPTMGNGFWTRANSEPCLLATRGKPRRLHADVPQIILEPRREHSRKPDVVYRRIERLVTGPYLELFARQRWPRWDAWGNELDRP